MQLEHKFSVPAPVDVVWQALLDPERVAPCFPGATIKSVEGNEFSGTVKVKLGPVSLMYKGSGEFTETDESSRKVVIKASGKDSRGNGTASADVTVSLKENGDSTDGSVVTDLNITGKPAQFGRGMIADVGGKILDTFASCLAEKLGGSGDDAGAEAGGAAAAGGGDAATSASSGSSGSSSSSTSTSSSSSSGSSGSSGSEGSEGSAGTSGAPKAADSTAKPAPAPASGSAAKPAPGTSQPGQRREVKQESEAEPIDLFEYAGSSVAKRAIPAVVAVLAVIVGIIIWRKKS